MDHFYERNVSEIKNEYSKFLVNIMAPHIYEGIRSTYLFAVNAHNEFVEQGKHDPNIKSPGILKVFQIALKEIPTLNNNSIEIEANRIKTESKSGDFFDDLVRSVIKSYIILLIFANPKKRAEILQEEYHTKVEIKDFIHKCYIISARMIYNNPVLFWHDYPPLEIKRNQREACDLIKQAIHEAIMRVIPIKLVLKEYLQNNYIDDNDEVLTMPNQMQYMNIQSMINRDLNGVPQELVEKGALETESQDGSSEHGTSEQNQDKTNSEEIVEEDYATSSSRSETDSRDDTDNTNNDEFMKSVEKKLGEVEAEMNQEHQQTVQPAPANPIPTSIPQQPATKPEIQVVPPQFSQQGGIPKAELDDEIRELLKKDKVVTNFEPKRKLGKKDVALLREIEAQVKPKNEEPDRKLFFEHYMK